MNTQILRADKSGVLLLRHCLDHNEDVRAIKMAAGEADAIVPIIRIDRSLGVVVISPECEGYDLKIQIKLKHHEWEDF